MMFIPVGVFCLVSDLISLVLIVPELCFMKFFIQPPSLSPVRDVEHCIWVPASRECE